LESAFERKATLFDQLSTEPCAAPLSSSPGNAPNLFQVRLDLAQRGELVLERLRFVPQVAFVRAQTPRCDPRARTRLAALARLDAHDLRAGVLRTRSVSVVERSRQIDEAEHSRPRRSAARRAARTSAPPGRP
jgi:hypothetical protein